MGIHERDARKLSAEFVNKRGHMSYTAVSGKLRLSKRSERAFATMPKGSILVTPRIEDATTVQ